jgi:ankyrin repeat protein
VQPYISQKRIDYHYYGAGSRDGSTSRQPHQPASSSNSSLDNGMKLWRAVKSGQLPRVKYLLTLAASVTYHCEQDGTTSLHQAALAENTDILQLLLEAGASVDDEDRDGATALHYAFSRHVIIILIDAGADVDHEDHAGKTPGCRARERSNMGVVKQLLENHADPGKIYLTIGDGNNGGPTTQDGQNIEQARLKERGELEPDDAQMAANLITPSTVDRPADTKLSNSSPERKLVIGIVSTIHPRTIVKVTDRSLARRSRMAKRRQLTP